MLGRKKSTTDQAKSRVTDLVDGVTLKVTDKASNLMDGVTGKVSDARDDSAEKVNATVESSKAEAGPKVNNALERAVSEVTPLLVAALSRTEQFSRTHRDAASRALATVEEDGIDVTGDRKRVKKQKRRDKLALLLISGLGTAAYVLTKRLTSSGSSSGGSYSPPAPAPTRPTVVPDDGPSGEHIRIADESLATSTSSTGTDTDSGFGSAADDTTIGTDSSFDSTTDSTRGTGTGTTTGWVDPGEADDRGDRV